MSILESYRIDGKPVLDVSNSRDRRRLEQLQAMSAYIATPDDRDRTQSWLESRESILTRTQGRRTITDDNMGTEWTRPIPFPLPLWRIVPHRASGLVRREPPD